MTAGNQVLTKLAVIVNFAVKYNPNAAIFIAERLVASPDVDDAEPAHRETHIAIHKKAVVIGPAVRNLAVHVRQNFAIYALYFIEKENPTDSTHGYTPVSFNSLPGRRRPLSVKTRTSDC